MWLDWVKKPFADVLIVLIVRYLRNALEVELFSDEGSVVAGAVDTHRGILFGSAILDAELEELLGDSFTQTIAVDSDDVNMKTASDVELVANVAFLADVRKQLEDVGTFWAESFRVLQVLVARV